MLPICDFTVSEVMLCRPHSRAPGQMRPLASSLSGPSNASARNPL